MQICLCIKDVAVKRGTSAFGPPCRNIYHFGYFLTLVLSFGTLNTIGPTSEWMSTCMMHRSFFNER